MKGAAEAPRGSQHHSSGCPPAPPSALSGNGLQKQVREWLGRPGGVGNRHPCHHLREKCLLPIAHIYL